MELNGLLNNIKPNDCFIPLWIIDNYNPKLTADKTLQKEKKNAILTQLGGFRLKSLISKFVC